MPELLNRRFGPACGAIYSCVILFGYVFIFLPPVLYGGSITFSELTGWPHWAVLRRSSLLTGSLHRRSAGSARSCGPMRCNA